MTPRRLDTPKGASLREQVVESWGARAADGEGASAPQGVHPASATAPATRARPEEPAADSTDPADGWSAAASGRTVSSCRNGHDPAAECPSAGGSGVGASDAPRQPRGFARLPPDERRRIASLGGRAVPPLDRRFSIDREFAAQLGRKGGARTAELIRAGRRASLPAPPVNRRDPIEPGEARTNTADFEGWNARSPIARVVARVALLFERAPTCNRIVVYRTPGGILKVAEWIEQAPPPGLLGVYDRTVTVQQLVEDCTE